MFDVNENFVFDLTRSHCPNTALKRNLSMKLLIIKVKRHRTLQTTHLTSILKKYHCRNITATSITKESDLSFKVKLKEQNNAFIVDVRLEVNCRCNKNERADRKTCVKKNNKLRKKELSDEIINAQVSLEHHKLLSLGPPSELPVIHTENERRFHEKIITRFFSKQQFNKQRQAEIGRTQANAKQHPWTELLLFENYLLSSSTLSSKNKRRHSKKCTKNNYVGFNPF